MWVPKWYMEAVIRKQDDLERRVKRLELMQLEEAKNKMASLQDEKAGSFERDGLLTIEEIINQ